MLLLETVETIALSQNTIHNFLVGFTRPAALNTIRTVWLSVPLMTGMSAYIFS